MARALLLLTTFAALAAWAGAQGTAPPLSPADRVKFFKSNRTLVENLVDNGAALADAGDSLARAEACKQTANSLANALKLTGGDPDRVAELADLMSVVVRDGLVPNLDDADRTIPAESKALRDRLGKARSDAAADIDSVGRAVVPGAAGDNPRVKAALGTLAALKAQIKK